MIKSVLVKNFRSIRERLVLDLAKSNRKRAILPNYHHAGNIELASSTVIYGANASGKSNLLRALKALQYLVLNSSKFAPDDAITAYEPFRLVNSTLSAPVMIESEFFIENVRYLYSLQYSKNRVEFEKLIYYPSGREALLFERTPGSEITFGVQFKGEKKIIEKLTLPNQLFLSKAAENNAESCLPVFHYFKSQLLVYPFLEQYDESELERLYAKRLANEPHSMFSHRLNTLICALDTGIRSITARETDWKKVPFPYYVQENLKQKFQEDFKFEIKTSHDLYDDNNTIIGTAEFDLRDESVGTRTLLPLAGIILESLEKGSVLVIDEFEKNLHPIIISYLIKLFSTELTNPKKAQLLFATHDISQINDELFNRDQIWFTQKNEFGETELFRCSDIKGLRLHAPLDKWYISGRLGGTAIINDTDFILAMQEE